MGWLNNAKNKAKIVINGVAAYAKSPNVKKAATKFVAASLTIAVVEGMAGYNPQNNTIQIGKHVLQGSVVTQKLYNGIRTSREYSLQAFEEVKKEAASHSFLNTSKYEADRPIIRSDESARKDGISADYRADDMLVHDKGMEMSTHEPSLVTRYLIENVGMLMKDSVHKANMELYLRDAAKNFSLSNGLDLSSEVRQNLNMSLKETLDGVRVTNHEGVIKYQGTVMNESSKADIFYCEPTSSYLVMTTVNHENGDVRRNLSEWSKEEAQQNYNFAKSFMSNSKFFEVSGGPNGVDSINIMSSDGLPYLIAGSKDIIDWHYMSSIQKQYQKDGSKLNLIANMDSSIDSSMKQGIIDDKNGIMVKVEKEGVCVIQNDKNDISVKMMNDKDFSNWQAILPDASPIKAINAAYERLPMSNSISVALLDGERNVSAFKMQNGLMRVEEQTYPINETKGYSLESHASSVSYMTVENFNKKYEKQLNATHPTHYDFREVTNIRTYDRNVPEVTINLAPESQGKKSNIDKGMI